MFFLNRSEWLFACEKLPVWACSMCMSVVNYGGHRRVDAFTRLECICIWNSKVRANVFLSGRVPEEGREISLSYFTCQTLKKDQRAGQICLWAGGSPEVTAAQLLPQKPKRQGMLWEEVHPAHIFQNVVFVGMIETLKAILQWQLIFFITFNKFMWLWIRCV